MKESIDCPKLVEQSKKVQKGQHWLVELLVFVTVYIIAAFGEMLILLPGELVLLNTNTAYQDAAASGDMEQLSEVSVQIAGSDAYAVFKLFSGIAMLLVVVLFCRKFQKRSFEMIGFVKEHALREYAIGLGLGVVFAVVTGGIAVAAGNAKLFTGTAPGMLVLFLLGYLIQGMAEELLYRGVVERRLSLLCGSAPAIVLSAVIFGVMHWNVVQFLYAGILGLLLAWLLERTGFLYAPVLAHIGANVMAVVRSETGWLDIAYQPTAAGVTVTVLLFAVAAFAVLLVKKGGVRQEEEKTSAA
mgnify:FL=1